MTLASRAFSFMAKLPRAQTHDVSVERDVATKMPDGVVLLADRWYPMHPPSGDVPAILMRTPYGRRQMGMFGRLFAERGYQAVIQSCRGTFGSGGEFYPFRNERADGQATLEWITGQPWFGGKLATFGPSYLGLTQWAVVEGAPDHLQAIALDMTASNFRDAVVYPGGSFALETTLTWMHQVEHQELGVLPVLRGMLSSRRHLNAGSRMLPLRDSDERAIGRHVDFFEDWLTHDATGDPWWHPYDFGRQLDNTPPASLVGGWYDLFLPSQIADYEALRAAGRDARLTIGAWSHVSPGGIAASIRDGLEWFDGHLRDIPSRLRRDRVRIFVMGARHWIDLPAWPPKADHQIWHLHTGGRLSPIPPVDSRPDHYRYDPADPTPGIGGPSLDMANAGAKRQQKREARPDVLTYTSEALSHDLTIAGPLSADLYLRSSLDHTDFFIRLCDVSPKGKSINLSDGIVRLGPGDVTKSADGTFRLRINMWPTANRFGKGHRIRLQVSSGAHPLFVRNLGGGEPLGNGTRLCVANQEVIHDPDHPSSVTLPVIG